jgi:hypothetical protein
MTMLVEGDLQIALPTAATGRKFDDAAHGLSHCMKAVDFIVEHGNQVFFLELKDPEAPSALAQKSAAYIDKFRSGDIDTNLKIKCRDSWLYEYAQGRVNKPIIYLVLIGASTLSAAELLARTDALKRQIPVFGPGDRPWVNPFVKGCAVMNIAAWNKALPQFQVSRVSA